MVKYSIIIPSYNRRDLLETCLQSIEKTISLDNVEIIVVCNGCTDGSPEYIKSLGAPYKVVYWDKPLGYAKAINLGVVVSKGEYLILLNNDSQFLNTGWLDMLEAPFKKHVNVGITGPAGLERSNMPWLIFFCVMIKKEVFMKVGYLDESYGIGGGEDTDFCIKAYRLGYTNYMVPENSGSLRSANRRNSFPIYHVGGLTCNTFEQMKDVNRANEARLTELYGPP